MTKCEKAEAVMAAFQHLVQCGHCGRDWQSWLMSRWGKQFLCIECNFNIMNPGHYGIDTSGKS